MPEKMSVDERNAANNRERRRRREESIGDPYEYSQRVIRNYQESRLAHRKAVADRDPLLRYDPKTDKIRLASDMEKEEVSGTAVVICLLFLGISLLGVLGLLLLS